MFFSLVVVYLAYWIGSSLFGPRYYYEGLYSLTIFTAAGIVYLSQIKVHLPRRIWNPHSIQDNLTSRSINPTLLILGQRAARVLVGGLVVLLISLNLVYYTPLRLETMMGLYGMKRSNLDPFLSPQAQAFTPALIIVHSAHWMPYRRSDAARRSLANDPLHLCLGYLSGNGCGCGG